MKYEEVYLKAYASIVEARRELADYFRLVQIFGVVIKALTS